MAKFGAFHDTRNLFIELTGYKKPLSYEEWCKQPDDLKAGLLFVQFYNEITLAWDKADSIEFGDDSEGVSTVLQYLQKQVKQTQYFYKDNPEKKAPSEFRKAHPDECVAVENRIIESNPNKFSSAYIYKVAYNCLYCICGHDRKCDKDRIEFETSAIVEYDGDEVCLFDRVADRHGSAEDEYGVQSMEREFWKIIEDSGLAAEKVMRYLLSQNDADLKALKSRSAKNSMDPLKDVEVSIESVDSILAQLRERFLDVPVGSACGQFISHFQTSLA